MTISQCFEHVANAGEGDEDSPNKFENGSESCDEKDQDMLVNAKESEEQTADAIIPGKLV